MYYDADKNDHGLPFAPYKACVAPRPIGWISTISRAGQVNLAPYSQFNTVGYDPGYLMFSAGLRPQDLQRKDSVVNAEETGEFVYNMATWALREAVSLTAAILEAGVDEMAAAGLTPAPSRRVRAPRVAESPISMECQYVTTLELPGDRPESAHSVVVGRVVGVHIQDQYLVDGKVDIEAIRPLARMGYLDYASIDRVFTLDIPDDAKATMLHGLMGGAPSA